MEVKMRAFIKYYFLSVLLIVLSSFSASYSAQSNSNRAFYAISSLCFHLKTQLLPNLSNNIFKEEDLLALWESAESLEDADEIIQAKDIYYKALQQDPSNAKILLAEVQATLIKNWKNLNPLWKKSSKPIAKGRNQFEFILPQDNPLRTPLDLIFSNPNVLNTPETFAEAGFKLISARSSGMYVASHPNLAGHLVKAYIISKKIIPNWKWAVYRCWGVRDIQDLINEKGLQHFVVPDKWIYPLGDYEVKGKDLTKVTSPAILVATHMNIVSQKESVQAWKSKVSKRHIEELYCIISHGLGSCTLPSNIPYTKEGKFTCIDTEDPRPNPSYSHINRHLSEEMADYWDYLVKTGGAGLEF